MANRVISYFFIFDFYHMKDATDENDLVPESIVYFYSPKEDFKRQKLIDCGEIVGLIQFFKHDLFQSLPREFNFKKSLVTCEHYGRHSAFLVLSKDRFTIDEANMHLTHILQLFNTLYGTLNHIQSIHSDIHQIQNYLKRTLTPILEYIFNENRSIQSLFSAVHYAPVKKNEGRSLLQIKHFLSHLESSYGIRGSLLAYEKQVLHSTVDTETTYYLQVILGLEPNLPANEIYVPLNAETKLKSGVSLIRIHIRRAPSLQPMLNAVNSNSKSLVNSPLHSQPVAILSPLLSDDNPISPLNFSSVNTKPSLSTSTTNFSNLSITEGTDTSSGDATDFDSGPTSGSLPTKEIRKNSVGPSFEKRKSLPVPQLSKQDSNPVFSPTTPDELRTDEDKIRHQYERSHSSMSDAEYENSSKIEQDALRFADTHIDSLIFEPIETLDGHESSCREEDIIDLPRMLLFSHFHRPRQRTLTSHTDHDDVVHVGTEHQEGRPIWGDVSAKNDEVERDELVLYIQRNSRMLFAGILERSLLNEEYLQKLWCFMVTEMADMDRDIQVIPISGETNKYSTDLRFQFNENSRRTQFERFPIGNRYYHKTPSSDAACLAFSARTKLNVHPERKVIGLSRGNNSISIHRTLPDRVTYNCRRFQEPK